MQLTDIDPTANPFATMKLEHPTLATAAAPEDVVLAPVPPGALRRAGLIGLAVLLLLGAGAAGRLYMSGQQADALAARTAQDAIRHVQTAHPRPGEAKRSLILPGTLQGQREAPIYARINGYLQRLDKDIGDRVKAGEVLALIDAPEAEQELQQARATIEQIRARLGLAESSFQRADNLRRQDAVSQQDLDERSAARQQARADLAAAQANVRRLEQLQAFRRVTAPFDGVVVRRNVDVGTLIGAGNNGANRELFYIAQTDPLRVDVSVPQTSASAVHPGQEVDVRLLERPGQPFKGTVTRTAGALDAATRTLQVEVKLPNPDGKLLPGAYVEVTLPLANPAKNLVVPVAALQYRQDGPRVAVVRKDAQGAERITLRPVKLGRDFGRTVEVAEGVTAEDAVVLNPHDAIEDGERVHAQAAAKREGRKP
jgi:multidrug efflux system membrane fusion protein